MTHSTRMTTEAGYTVRTQADIPGTFNPLYVTVEGCDRTGKSTALKRLVDYLRMAGKTVVQVAEPTPEARADFEANPPQTALEACQRFAEDRRQLLQNTVVPALHQRKVVVSDRSLYSSFAYQVGGYGLDLNECDRIVYKSLFPFSAPGQALFFYRRDGVDATPQNKDLIASIDGLESYPEERLERINQFYWNLVKTNSRIYKTLWRPVPALPSELQLREVFAMVLGSITGFEGLIERQWQKSIAEWR